VRRPFIIGWFVIAPLLCYRIIQHWLLVGLALANFGFTFLQAACHSAVPLARELAL